MDNVLSVFIVHGFRYCLFNNRAVNEGVKWSKQKNHRSTMNSGVAENKK